MKRIFMSLWLLATSIASVHAQTHFKTDAVSPSNALQMIEDANGYVGIGTTGLSSTSLPTDVVFSTGNLSYSSTLVPSAIMAVINKTSTSLPSPGNSGVSFAVIRTDGSPTNDPAVDCAIINTGAVGFGTTPDQFFPSGTHFGIVDVDNTSTLPLFSTYTNTNNSTGYNLPALAIDYQGRVAIGAVIYGPTLSSQFFLTDPIGGTNNLMSVYTHSNDPSFSIKSDGKVGVGTNSPQAPLDVQGYVRIGDVSTPNAMTPGGYSLYAQYGILAEKFKCAVKTTTDWSDYVFDKSYKLPPLSDVESYIKANKHLPDVPSAEEVQCEGIDMAKMDATLLKKIEELTLYVLDLKKENERIKNQINQLRK